MARGDMRSSYVLIKGEKVRIPPKIRIIDGQRWQYYMWGRNKAELVKEADRQTKSYGLRTRVVPSIDKGYAIYYRSGK